ncbi:MAG: hypothetical protein Q8P75_01610 [bacterium]|nr:hypothetical protein [bacterium]
MEANIWQLLVRAFVIIIVIGGVYNLWRTAKTYGGIVGNGLRWLGLGMILFSLESLDRVLGNLSFISPLSGGANADLFHNIILLLGLLFSGIGFSKFTKIQ